MHLAVSCRCAQFGTDGFKGPAGPLKSAARSMVTADFAERSRDLSALEYWLAPVPPCSKFASPAPYRARTLTASNVDCLRCVHSGQHLSEQRPQGRRVSKALLHTDCTVGFGGNVQILTPLNWCSYPIGQKRLGRVNPCSMIRRARSISVGLIRAEGICQHGDNALVWGVPVDHLRELPVWVSGCRFHRDLRARGLRVIRRMVLRTGGSSRCLPIISSWLAGGRLAIDAASISGVKCRRRAARQSARA